MAGASTKPKSANFKRNILLRTYRMHSGAREKNWLRKKNFSRTKSETFVKCDRTNIFKICHTIVAEVLKYEVKTLKKWDSENTFSSTKLIQLRVFVQIHISIHSCKIISPIRWVPSPLGRPRDGFLLKSPLFHTKKNWIWESHAT